jgi:hypothetical protein
MFKKSWTDLCGRCLFLNNSLDEMDGSNPMNTRKIKKPIWVKPSFKDLPIFFEVCLYAGTR